MNRAEKAAQVEELRQGPGASRGNAILFAFAGLKVPEVTELRRQVRATKSQLPGRQEHRSPCGPPRGRRSRRSRPHFVGATAVAYNEDNPVGARQGPDGLREDQPEPGFQGGARRRACRSRRQPDQGDRRAADAARSLVGKLLFLMQSPLRRLVTVLNGPVRNLAGVVKQIAEQKTKSGAGEAAPAE